MQAEAQDIIVPAGDVTVNGLPAYFRIYRSDHPEHYFDRLSMTEGSHIKGQHGRKLYIGAKILTYRLRSNLVGIKGIHERLVVDERLKAQEIGSAQAWYYPEENLLVVWELLLNPSERKGKDPSQDPIYCSLWKEWEDAAMTQFQIKAARMVTPGWEPLFDNSVWQAFLKKQGYGLNWPAEKTAIKVVNNGI